MNNLDMIQNSLDYIEKSLKLHIALSKSLAELSTVNQKMLMWMLDNRDLLMI